MVKLGTSGGVLGVAVVTTKQPTAPSKIRNVVNAKGNDIPGACVKLEGK